MPTLPPSLLLYCSCAPVPPTHRLQPHSPLLSLILPGSPRLSINPLACLGLPWSARPYDLVHQRLSCAHPSVTLAPGLLPLARRPISFDFGAPPAIHHRSTWVPPCPSSSPTPVPPTVTHPLPLPPCGTSPIAADYSNHSTVLFLPRWVPISSSRRAVAPLKSPRPCTHLPSTSPLLPYNLLC